MSADELMPLVTVARFSYHDSEKHIGVGGGDGGQLESESAVFSRDPPEMSRGVDIDETHES